MKYLENIETAFFAEMNKRAVMPQRPWRFVRSTKSKYKKQLRLCVLYRRAMRLEGVA
jgi:hypothetical protein